MRQADKTVLDSHNVLALAALPEVALLRRQAVVVVLHAKQLPCERALEAEEQPWQRQASGGAQGPGAHATPRERAPISDDSSVRMQDIGHRESHDTGHVAAREGGRVHARDQGALVALAHVAAPVATVGWHSDRRSCW